MSWCRFHRSLLDHELWLGEPFTRGQAWVDLFARANWTDREVWMDGRSFSVKRGQMITSILKLAERWMWSRDKVRRFLGELQNAQMIALKIDTKKTTITIHNYDEFQRERVEDRHDPDTTPTAIGQQIDNRPTTDRQQTDTNKKKQELKEKKEGEEGKRPPAPVPPSQTIKLKLSHIELNEADFAGLVMNTYHGDEAAMREHAEAANDHLCAFAEPPLKGSAASAAYVRGWKRKSAEFAKGANHARASPRETAEERKRRELDEYIERMDREDRERGTA